MTDMHSRHYTALAMMTLLSFISMYVLMYAMVDSFGNVFNNVNQLYMAGLMTAPMVAIEFLFMRSMYGNSTLNVLLLAASIAAALIFWLLIRSQTAVSDEQFLRSMIPHHAGAILMCTEAPVDDPAIRELCANIIKSQQSEIDWMREKLRTLEGR